MNTTETKKDENGNEVAEGKVLENEYNDQVDDIQKQETLNISLRNSSKALDLSKYPSITVADKNKKRSK